VELQYENRELRIDNEVGEHATCNLLTEKEYHMIYAYVLIEAEPTRVQDLIKELPDMELDGSVIKQVHAVTGRYDLIAFVESPDMQSLGN
jgi:DNA-binding Lrp family transcriptional regulator